MTSKLYKNRFELFFISQLLILFGSLIIPIEFFRETLMPILFLFNIASGIILISKKKIHTWGLIILFCVSLLLLAINIVQQKDDDALSFIGFGVYFLFYATVTVEIIRQVWNAKEVNKNVIVGLMSGYVSLGLIAFFVFSSIELSDPGAFKGLLFQGTDFSGKLDSLLYYSYITVLTIGYGDIVPVTSIAQKAAMFVGLCGQFYIVIITAVVVQKFLAFNDSREKKD
ncbi:ion channel [Tamlana sp. 2201CG12-4]|uniref:ion channel n=1 Tax=Tamlana sp. 2201CG12-4 TaxID=3112582 RepID=UPI002DBF0A9D|nr:ion channel [Tamlana sp. 2201CG12-4]MEC3906785.1 ion channel [Tamlana sp. 2201CG12-4]